MNNFIFKSANRLTKNSSISLSILNRQLDFILKEQRHQRSDLRTLSQKIDKILVDKHLQMQVDEYYNDNPPEMEKLGDSDDN